MNKNIRHSRDKKQAAEAEIDSPELSVCGRVMTALTEIGSRRALNRVAPGHDGLEVVPIDVATLMSTLAAFAR